MAIGETAADAAEGPQLGRLPQDREHARREVETFSQKIAGEALTVRALAHTLKGAKKFIEQAAREYAERFLHELIQNAYDAHPTGSAGTVKVLLEVNEGKYGTLYVANTGLAFTDRDFRSICEIAQSSKRPGQGIGNKGIGFKSVLQICEWPEIYSRSIQSTNAFDGYCFTFARPTDILRLASGDAQLARLLADRLSPYGLPVPIEPTAATVQKLAAEGFASVIRLPLRNARALELASRQLAEIASSPAPALLFLDRLGVLALETREPDRTTTWTGRRVVRPLDGPSGVDLAEVDLGPAGQFLTVSRRLDRGAFLEAIERSIDATLVDEEWRDWDGEAFVSIALSLDGAELEGRLYCYLPMGRDAASPLNGYLNAPFAVTLARQALVPSVPLNEFLFDAAASAAALAAPYLRLHPRGRSLVPDLVTWRHGHAARVASAFLSLDRPIAEELLLPTASHEAWGTFGNTYRWSSDFTTFTPGAISDATDDEILDPDIGSERSDRLEAFAETLPECTLEPDPVTVARWAEAVARNLAGRTKRRRTFDPGPWSGLYDDLAHYFAGRDAGVLRGRALLIDDDLKLHLTWGGTETGDGASIFFPLREMSDPDEPSRDATIPKTLGRHLAYVHAGIPWTSLNPETKRYENRPGRDFLDRAGLVRLPRTRDLLERISRVLARRRDKQLHADALRLVYNLTSGRSYSQEPALNALHLRVPTASGAWIPASRARFSDAWGGTMGPAVGRLIRQASGVSQDLDALSGRLLAAPAEFGFRLDSVDAWISFLRSVGVRDGLWPEELETRAVAAKGWWWTTNSFASAVPLSDAERKTWGDALAASPDEPRYPYTEYRLVGPIMRITGSAEYNSLPSSARETYGRLIVAGLANWPDEALRVRIARPRGGNATDPVVLPSPALAFLREAPWMPVTRPGEAGIEDFIAPPRAWHYRDDEADAQPTFMPLLVSEVRAALEASPQASGRAAELGIHVWNEPRDAFARLRELARVFAELEVPDTLVANFRKACERTWATISRIHSPDGPLPFRQEDVLIVSRHGRLGAFAMGHGEEVLHVLVDEDRLTPAVLDALDAPVLQADPRDGAVLATILKPLLGERLRAVAATDVRVLVDGAPVDEADGVPLVDRGREWLTDLVALTLEFKASAFNRQSVQRVRTSLETLRAIRLHPGSRADITMGSQPIELPSHIRRVFALSDPVRPRIAFEGTAEPLDWGTLELLAPKIGELVGAANALENAIMVVGRRRGGGLVSAPSDQDYSAAFEQSVERIVEVRRAQRGVIVGLLYLLRPIVRLYLHGQDPIGDALAGGSPPSNAGELADLLEPWEKLFPDGKTAALLVEAATSAETLGHLRDLLEIDYAALNASLRALAPDYDPIHNTEGQSFAFAAHIARHLAELQRDLRDRSIPLYDAGEVPTAYAAAARELLRAQLRRERQGHDETPVLGPDPAWLDAIDVPSDPVMRKVVSTWVDLVAPRDVAESAGLPVEELRLANARALASFVRTAAVTLPVWTRKQSGVVPPTWIVGGDTGRLIGSFRDAGLLDFRTLDDAAIIVWARRLELWPTPLPDTVDAAELGITPNELAAQTTTEERERWERAQARRTVALDGRPVTLDVETAHDLIDSIRAGITETLLSATSRPRALATIRPRRTARRAGGGGGSRGEIRRLTSDQTDLIGFMGELVAFEWLKRQYAVGAEAWRSRNRRFAFSDDDGDDSLGYDFEVMQKRPLLFEVKATTTDELSFEMSEKELRVAGDNAGNDRYRILFVGRVNDSGARSLMVLPNPLSARGYDRYRVIGRGIQYQFAVADLSLRRNGRSETGER